MFSSFLFKTGLVEMLAPSEKKDINEKFQKELYDGNTDVVLKLLHDEYDAVNPENRTLDINLPPVATAGNRPIHIAAAKGLKEVVIALLERGVDVHSEGAMKNTPLHYAARHNHHQLVAELLQRGAETARTNCKGLTPLELATEETTKLLLSGHTDRAAAISHKNDGTEMDVSVDQDPWFAYPASTPEPVASVTFRLQPNGTIPLTPGSELKRRSLMPPVPDQLLGQAVKEAAQGSAITLALDMKQWERRQKLFRLLQMAPTDTKKEDTNLKNSKSNARALQMLKERLLTDPELLHSRAANFKEMAKDGWTLIHTAAAFGNLEALKMLLEEFQASAWVRDCQGRTALHIAAEHGHVGMCEFLKAKMGSDGAHTSPVGRNAPIDLSGRTPLAWSGKKRTKPLTDVLFKQGDPTVFPLTPCAMELSGGEGDMLYGFYEVQGFRQEMEDALLCQCPIPDFAFPRGTGIFGVFDGHGGDFASKFCSTNFLSCLTLTDEWQSEAKWEPTSLEGALRNAFLMLDLKLRDETIMKVTKGKGPCKFDAEDSSGSTGLVAIVTPSHVIVASLGDSRAVLYKASKGDEPISPLQMNIEDKPGLEEERKRIEAARGQVVTENFWGDCTEDRVKFDSSETSLGMSRALGDFFFKQQLDDDGNLLPPDKQIVSAVASIQCHAREEDDDFLILACDGVWDVLSNEDAGDIFRSSLQNLLESCGTLTHKEYKKACANVLEAAIQKGTSDNMSIISVDLKFDVSQRGKNLEDRFSSVVCI